MKKTIFLISLVSIYFLVSCKEKETKTTIASNTTHLKSDTLKFEIDFPKTWNAIKNPENPKVIHLEKPLADSTSSEYAENIMIWSEQLPMNILDSIYHLTAIAQLKIKNPHLIITNNGAKKMEIKNSTNTLLILRPTIQKTIVF